MIHRIYRFIFILIFLLSAFLSGVIFFVIHNHTIDFSILSHYNAGRSSLLLDDEGNEWARFQLDRRDPMEGECMPQHLINAFMAAEDWNFFTHHGIGTHFIQFNTTSRYKFFFVGSLAFYRKLSEANGLDESVFLLCAQIRPT